MGDTNALAYHSYAECFNFHMLVESAKTHARKHEKYRFWGAYIPPAEVALYSFVHRGGVGRYSRMRETMMILAGAVMASIDDIHGDDADMFEVVSFAMDKRLVIDDELISQMDIIYNGYYRHLGDNGD